MKHDPTRQSVTGQGSLEIILLMGGGVLISMIVLMLILNTVGSDPAHIEQSLFDSQSALQQAANLVGNLNDDGDNDGDPDPPIIPNLTLSASTGENAGTINLLLTTDIDLLSMHIIGIPTINAPTNVDASNFVPLLVGNPNVDYELNSTTPILAGNQPSLATGLETNTPYSFFVIGCAILCTVATASATSGDTTPTPDTTPPIITAFSLAWDDAKVIITFNGSDPGIETPPVSFIAIRGTDQTLVNGITTQGPTNSFDNPPTGITVIPLGTIPGEYTDTGLVNNVTYYYRLRACDNTTPIPNCTTNGNALPIMPHVPIYSFAVEGMETVIDWKSTGNQFCNEYDVPDSHIRAFRTNDPTQPLVLFAGNAARTDKNCKPETTTCEYDLFVRRATNFEPGSIQSDCANRFTNGAETIADNFNNLEWFWSGYYENGKLHTIIYNEFHDPLSPTICKLWNGLPATTLEPDNLCRYTGLTYTYSMDNGHTYQNNPTINPVVAGPPLKWNPATMAPEPAPTDGGYGFFDITNIIKREESGITYYYALVIFNDIAAPFSRVCTIRTTNLDDPSSWRAWGGTAYNVSMNTPYPNEHAGPPCTSNSLAQTGRLLGTITYNTYMKKYLHVGNMIFNPGTGSKCGFYYSTSDDLRNWSKAQLFVEQQHIAGTSVPSLCNNTTGPVTAYGGMIDHDQLFDLTDPNFEKSDNTFHIYYTYFPNHSGDAMNRDLVRQKVTVTKS